MSSAAVGAGTIATPKPAATRVTSVEVYDGGAAGDPDLLELDHVEVQFV